MYSGENRGSIIIQPLSECRECIPQLAKWHHGQWSSLNPGETLAGRIGRLEVQAANQEMPATWVAFDGTKLVGSASLVPSDMEIRPDFEPWLASVFVNPETRSRGIGSQLVEYIMQQARELEFEQLYLFTPDRQTFYQRLGWSLRETVTYHEMLVKLMEIKL